MDVEQKKLRRYSRLAEQLTELLRDIAEPIARRATLVALVHHKLSGVSWTGFYMLRQGKLVVDVYQGLLACPELPPHKGVCWAGIDTGRSVVVPDVETFAGHIPCDARTRSEIVVPLLAGGEPAGVLDLDSRRPARFDEADRVGLEKLVSLL